MKFLNRKTKTRLQNIHILSCRAALSLFIGNGLFLHEGKIYGAETTDHKPVPVALVEFQASDVSYKHDQQATLFADLLMAALSDGCSGIRYVERQETARIRDEMNLSLAGILSAADNVRIGKWTQADLILNGTFHQNEDYTWYLLFDLIDVQHGSLYKTVYYPDENGLESIIQFNDHLDQIVAELCPQLLHFHDQATRITVAPLFFHNAEPYGRLDFFEQDIFKGIHAACGQNTNLNVLTFSRVRESMDEADYLLSGFIETDLAEWVKLADCYAWGWYSEITPKNTPFPDVQVRFDGAVWNTQNVLYNFTCSGTVSQLDKLAAEIGRQVAQSVEKGFQEKAGRVTRRDAANILYSNTCDRLELGAQLDISERRTIPEATFNRWQYGLQQLYTIVFFDPENIDACVNLALEKNRYDYDIFYWSPSFTRDWERSKTWAWLFERTEKNLLFDDYRIRAKRHFSIDNRCHYFNDIREAYLDSAHTMLKYIDIDVYPDQIPPDLPAKQWHRLEEGWINTLVHRIDIASKNDPSWEIPPDLAYKTLELVLRYIGNIQDRKKAIDALLESAMKCGSFTNNQENQGFFKREIGRTYSVQGKTVKVSPLPAPQPETMEEQISEHPPTTTSEKDKRLICNAAELHTNDLPAIEILTAHPSLSVQNGRELRFPGQFEHNFFSHQLGGIKWPNSNMAFAGEKLYITANENLFCFSFSNHQLLDYSKILKEHTDFNDLIATSNTNLLLAFSHDGIWAFNPTTLTINKMTSRQGLPSLEIYDIALFDDILFASGGESKYGMLAECKNGDWQEYVFPPKLRDPRLKAYAPVQYFAINNDWIAAYSATYFCYIRLLIYNRKNKTWQELSQPLKKCIGNEVPDYNQEVRHIQLEENRLYVCEECGIFTIDLGKKNADWKARFRGTITGVCSYNDAIWFSSYADGFSTVKRLDCRNKTITDVVRISGYVARIATNEKHLILILNAESQVKPFDRNVHYSSSGRCLIYDFVK